MQQNGIKIRITLPFLFVQPQTDLSLSTSGVVKDDVMKKLLNIIANNQWQVGFWDCRVDILRRFVI